VAAFPAIAASQSIAQSSDTSDSRIAERGSTADGNGQPTPARDVVTRRDGAVFVGAYGWPYRDVGRDYTDFGPRYRDYARDYGNFAYHYRGFAPRYRDFVRDYGEFAYDYQPAPSYRAPEMPKGHVSIDVLPTSAQVFVDGEYVGMSYELGGGFTLEAGPHRLEFRADDHEPVALDTRIEAGRAITFEGTLVRRNAQPEPQPLPTRVPATMTIYFLPRCYMGNVPPIAARLPAGCDISEMKVIPR
jgi:hypothetical protein